ncbi:MAG: LysM peptidoglycan-binding domain-containing protein [Flavobacteriales bacterium]|nr:LysM peptidoglycan-binding domain-containing protein [Flavobacteriales bacterium]
MRRAIRPMLLGLLLFLTGTLLAQERTIDGKRFKEHTVEAGETLFAIGRHYAVPMDALLLANPAAASGLSIGQVVLVPVDAIVKKEARNAPELRDGELLHTVARKETLFGIARQYNVEINDLLERNPEAVGGLPVGMALVIPVDKVRSGGELVLGPATSSGAPLHQVAPGETLFSLAQRYETTPETIRQANGGLSEGLKAGQYLRMPLPEVEEVVNAIAADSLMKQARYRIALLLPFCLERNDSVHQADPNFRGLYELTQIGTQFHGGAMMALDSLRMLGLSADVFIRDVGAEAGDWDPVLRDPEMRSMDLYLGPFHRAAIDQLSAISKDGHIVCPVPQSNRVVLGNPKVSKVISGRTEQVYQVGRYVASKHAGDNIVLLVTSSTEEGVLQQQMRKILNSTLRERPDRMQDSVAEAHPGKGDLGDLNYKLKKDRTNVLVVPSEHIEYVTSLVTKLASLTDQYTIKVFGLQAWEEMTHLEVLDLNKLNLHVPVPTFIDFQDPRVVAFVRRYRERFHADPGDFAFLGFDATFFYGKGLLEFGTGFPAHFEQVVTDPLHMRFRMQRMGMENGYVNDSAIIVEYRDLKRVLVK